ncbi:unnamed protein product [Brachionus calyciflorus]|uniref:SOCS box domain-containing protein n=1 Tax=Brachionus calyciflorus TaxID=104777 RepID=A0A813SQW1_9BILA|nr:unnamed protein product [Brachionus calyciflorus]
MKNEDERGLLKVKILNHRTYLTSLIDDPKQDDVDFETKRAKTESLDDCLRSELSSPIQFDYESLRLTSNFDSSDSSTSISNKSSCSSSPRSHRTQSPIDISLDEIKLFGNEFESKHFYLSQNFLKYNLNHLNLVKKETLIFLIEKNLANNIKNPFDLFSYNRLNKSQKFCHNPKNNYNCFNIRKMSKLLNHYKNPLNKRYLRDNCLLPSSVGMFLMPLYFDIFKISELNQFNPIEIDMILLLKRTYRTHVYLDYESLINNFKENILWSCFILCKYKLSDITGVNSNQETINMEFFNYYLSLMYTLQHLEYVVNYIQLNSAKININNSKLLKDHITKALDLSRFLPFLFESLILNGYFKHKDYVAYEKFCVDKLDSLMCTNEYNLERNYYENTLMSIKQHSEQVYPLKLTNMCRITIKNSMKKYDSSTLDKLNVPKDIKKFLLYEHELNNYYIKYKNSINHAFN